MMVSPGPSHLGHLPQGGLRIEVVVGAVGQPDLLVAAPERGVAAPPVRLPVGLGDVGHQDLVDAVQPGRRPRPRTGRGRARMSDMRRPPSMGGRRP